LSQAVAKLSTDDVPIFDWQEVRGAGVMARVADSALRRPQSSPREAALSPNSDLRSPISERNQCLLTSAATSTEMLVRLGSLHWLAESGVDLARGQSFAAEWSAQGATILGLAVEQT